MSIVTGALIGAIVGAIIGGIYQVIKNKQNKQ
ncbi:MAG: glycine zipper domain-containing protein [Candidatus Gastranaerophilales bacterium]|nr:glycine zipper domain-containing protein [Candidatus Gastranaerophilales bacterium]